MLCAAPTVLIGLANAPRRAARGAPRGVRVLTAGAPPAAATIERIEGELGWTVTHVYGLTETAPFITICEPRPEHAALMPATAPAIKARQGVELITSGELRVVDEEGHEVPRDGATLGEIVVRGNVVMAGYYNDPEATAQGDPRRLVPLGRRRGRPSRWLRGDPRPAQGRDHQRRREHLIGRGRRACCCAIRPCRRSAVVGLPDERWGEAPHAFVVLKPGAGRAEELREFCAGATRALQEPPELHLRRRAAEDGHRQDPEVRPARGPLGRRRAMMVSYTRAGDSGTDPARAFQLRITSDLYAHLQAQTAAKTARHMDRLLNREEAAEETASNERVEPPFVALARRAIRAETPLLSLMSGDAPWSTSHASCAGSNSFSTP